MHIREISQTNLALGSDVTLSIITNLEQTKTDQLFRQLWKQVYSFERQFSRFLPMSELSTFNRETGINTPISTEFKNILLQAQQIGIETQGLFNPFITPALQKVGYIKSAVSGYEHDKQSDYTDRKVVNIEQLEIGKTWARIPYKTALDLGGCGKGYLADQLGKFLRIKGIQGYWLSLGGDIVTMGYDANGNNISLNIQDANNHKSVTDWVVDCPIEHFAVATSGTFRRKGQTKTNDWHHIIDPLTLEPAVTDVRLATVCADTAIKADILASCAIILGSKKAPAFLKKHGVKSILLQCIDKLGIPFEIKFGYQIQKKADYHRHNNVSIYA